MAGYGSKKDKIIELLNQGLSYSKISEMVDCSKGTISYHANNSKQVKRATNRNQGGYDRGIDWAEVQNYYELGHSAKECQERFGFSKSSWTKAANRGDVVPRPRGFTLESVLVENSTYARGNLKRKLLKEGVLENRCYIEGCPLNHINPEWCGSPITLVLDHINGVNNDNRLENLRMLCGNCNSQTETFAGKNTKNPKRNPKPYYTASENGRA